MNILYCNLKELRGKDVVKFMNGFNRCCGGGKGFTGVTPVVKPSCSKPVAVPSHVGGAAVLPGSVGPNQWDSISRVQEPAVECVQEFHHYAKVEHVIPVHVKNIHHQHTQHDYIVQQAGTTDETLCYEYGLECEKDVCDLIAQCGCR